MNWPLATVIIAAIFAVAWVLRMVIVAVVSIYPPKVEGPKPTAGIKLVKGDRDKDD
jgi:hypothetical protein